MLFLPVLGQVRRGTSMDMYVGLLNTLDIMYIPLIPLMIMTSRSLLHRLLHPFTPAAHPRPSFLPSKLSTRISALGSTSRPTSVAGMMTTPCGSEARLRSAFDQQSLMDEHVWSERIHIYVAAHRLWQRRQHEVVAQRNGHDDVERDGGSGSFAPMRSAGAVGVSERVRVHGSDHAARYFVFGL
jgi:hypothetical protein